ncbi:hypothetical protein CONLIGDRAFT_632023 [Coniochaeta ligniaria NRRL 30616]|uniref:Uncharacterized protein n=1 Tax=Coniochaeta ligniaria NRRL 30616 TaxID=1408157 RepID=A0A1J7IQM1_9PEZI|nr:hypothetical protein CONLIGDRAFT_632023 [Coniochaeta ligniaria NRRL 30616]
MGRLGPLTSQGLGRSPYDDAVQGEGEPDPREPPQQYDERGRPVNPVTRQINKDIIRSHNEVMQVIGVAEPENVFSEPQALTARHDAWENALGSRLLRIGRFVQASGACGINGMRQRILLYQSYSHVPLLELWSHERRQRSLSAIVFAGYPAFAIMSYNKLRPRICPWIIDHPYYRPLYRVLKTWIRLHLNVFAVLQQLEILPASSLLPDLKFFIPYSSSSPIPAPSPPASFTGGEILKWVGNLALNAAPLLAICVCDRVFADIRGELWQYLCFCLPAPWTSHGSYRAAIRAVPDTRAAIPGPEAERSTTPPQSPAPPTEPTPEGQPELNAGGFPTTSQMRPRDEPQGQQEPTPPEESAPAPTDPVSPGRVRRQSTVSTRGMSGGAVGADFDYGSDDEDNSGDMVSTTLISFDVEATDATDPPPGQWSAELRPNVAEGSRSDGAAHSRPARQPNYRSTMLTRLPFALATDMLAWVPSRFFSAPFDAVVWRWFVRSLLGARGISVEGVYPVWYWGFSKHMVANFIGIELVHFFIQFDVWAAIYSVGSYFLVTEEEWSYVDGPGNEVD